MSRLIDLPDVRARLLAAVAAVPIGTKLSIPRLRDALIDQGDVIAALSSFVESGELDRATLRPTRREPQPQAAAHDAPPTGAELADQLVRYAESHGLALIRVGDHLFGGNKSGIGKLRKTKRPIRRTIDRVTAFLAAPPPEELKRQRSGDPRVPQNGNGVTGAELADALDAMIAKHGLSKVAVSRLVYSGSDGSIERLRRCMPQRSTVEKVRALLADPPIEQLRTRGPVTREEEQPEGARAPAAPKPSIVRQTIDIPRQPKIDPQTDIPRGTFLKPAEVAWCSQCDQRVSGAKAARCTSRWCSLKEDRAA